MINQLRVEWSINAQYAFGWTVPFLIIYLLAERWKTRPATSVCQHRGLVLGALSLLAISLLPARVVQEAAPDWRLVGWAMAAAVVGLSLGAVYLAGGSPWFKHFAFPIFFFLIAVPWPVPIEQSVIQHLMRSVAGICVETLGWLGIPATQHGNVIETGGAVVGVEEACSGVRSLQTTLMASLFLGELFRFGLSRRFILIGGGLFLAFVCNAGRALALVWITASKGTEAVEKWHDSIGLSVLIVTMCGLALLGAALRGRGAALPAAVPGNVSSRRPHVISRGLLTGLLIWLASIEAGTEIWYRSHEMHTAKVRPWSVELPVQKAHFREIALPQTTRAILRYDEAHSATWSENDGSQWSLVFLRWLPGRASVQLARAHGPEICLPASGSILLSDLGFKPLRTSKIELLTHAYIFAYRSGQLYVFYCLSEDQRLGDKGPGITGSLTPSKRMRAVWTGRRNQGQQVLEVAISGPRDASEAEAAAVRVLGDVIR